MVGLSVLVESCDPTRIGLLFATTVLSKSSDSSDLPDTSRLAIPDGRVSAPSLGLLDDEFGSTEVPESFVVSRR